MKIARVVLTKEEAGWFARNVPKMMQLLDAYARKDESVKTRTTYKTLASMLQQAADINDMLTLMKDAPSELDLQLTKKQKAVIKDLIATVNSRLKLLTIPEYERRGDSHKDYLENAVKKTGMLDRMERKFK